MRQQIRRIVGIIAICSVIAALFLASRITSGDLSMLEVADTQIKFSWLTLIALITLYIHAKLTSTK